MKRTKEDETRARARSARPSNLKTFVRMAAAMAMITVGVLHFVSADGFVKIVPAFLPAPYALVLISGVCEILGGIGLLLPHPRIRFAASIGLIALYLAVFPANINMAVNNIQPAGYQIPRAAMWARLPFQALFIAVAWWLRR